MFSVLITGANRGLGLGLLQKLLEHPEKPSLVIATCRNPSTANELKALASEYSILRIVQLDVNDTSTFESFADEVACIVGEEGLNVLINNAGIGADKDNFSVISEEDYLSFYQTNVIGPIFLTKALLPLIQKTAEKNQDKPLGKYRAAIVNISTMLASLNLNVETGGYYGYRESKTALNMFSRNLSLEMEVKDAGILVVSLHPGWVKTDLGGEDAPLEVEESVSGMCNVVHDLNETMQGGFLQWDGEFLPW